MGFFFTNTFKTALAANQALMTNATIKAAFFHQAPSLGADAATRYGSYDTMVQYTGKLGWEASSGTGHPPTETLVVNTRDGTGDAVNSRFVIFTQFPAAPGFGATLADTQVSAVAFIYVGTLGGVVNPVIFVTDTLFTPSQVVGGADAITASPDVTNLGASSNRWLFGWAKNLPNPSPVVGPLTLLKGPPSFEVSHTEHVWLYPQRINYIANPSFESGTAPLSHWRSNAAASSYTLPLLADGTPVLGTDGGYKSGKFLGTAPIIVESNFFPVHGSTDWTVQFLAMGNGTVKVSLLSWSSDFDSTRADWGDAESWTLNPGTYVHVQALRWLPDASTAQLRIEVQGTALFLDRVLVEPGFQLDWPYFDGDSNYGARGDFTWYGGVNRKGQTFSLWYNHKQAVGGRLFANPVDGPIVTSQEMTDHGLVYQWVPAGQVVTPHWDVLEPNDLQHAIADVAGTAVNPYKASPTDRMGVTNPWL